MSIYLDKLLPVLAFPLGLALALCLIALGLSVAGRHFASRIVLAVVILGLWVASMPAFAGLITATLEDQNPPIAVAAAPAADVIIVLGGGLASPRAELTEAGLGQAADRLGQAYALWRLLVTSAVHMPRALATFRAAGLDLIPWPADFQVQRPLVKSLFDLLPDAGALAMTSASAKEWLGLIVYRWREWA